MSNQNDPPFQLMAKMLGGVSMEKDELRQALSMGKTGLNQLLKNAAASGINVEIHTTTATGSDGIRIDQIVVVIDGEALPMG